MRNSRDVSPVVCEAYACFTSQALCIDMLTNKWGGGGSLTIQMPRRRATSWSLACFLALLALLSCLPAHAEKIEQLSPQGYVNDFAGVIDAPSKEKITALCQEVDEKAGAQIAVVTIHSLEGDTAQDFANRLFAKWGVGPKGKDRGVMVLLAVDDHQYWTEVGYGLEPILPDGKVGGFGREMLPLLRQNQYGASRLSDHLRNCARDRPGSRRRISSAFRGSASRRARTANRYRSRHPPQFASASDILGVVRWLAVCWHFFWLLAD